MKRLLAAVSILVLCLLLLLLHYFAFGVKQSVSLDESIGQSIGIKIPDYQDRKNVNNRGWFADGTEITIYQFDDVNAKLLKDQISQGEQWNTLPLTDNVSYIIEWSGAKEADIPYVENGYWYFSDETPPNAHPPSAYGYMGQFYGPPTNFDFAVFDSDTNTLYYYEFDS